MLLDETWNYTKDKKCEIQNKHRNLKMKVNHVGLPSLIISKITSSLQPRFQNFSHHALEIDAFGTCAFKKLSK